MTFLIGWSLALLGMLTLAFTQAKQARLLFGAAPAASTRLVFSIVGYALLFSSTYHAIAAYGLGVGLVTFFSHVCFAAWCVSILLTWRRTLS